MKATILLVGLGLFLLVVTVGCEEEHEHFHHDGRGGAYEGPYRGYGAGSGYGAYPHPGDDGYSRHD